MPPIWTNVYPNPDALELMGSLPGEEEAIRRNGVVLVPLYDYESQLVWYDWWEVRHEKTRRVLMHILADGQDAAIEHATPIADDLPWTTEDERSWPISAKLRDLIAARQDVYFYPIDPLDEMAPTDVTSSSPPSV